MTFSVTVMEIKQKKMKIDAQGSMWDLPFGGEKSRVSEGYELHRGVSELVTISMHCDRLIRPLLLAIGKILFLLDHK